MQLPTATTDQFWQSARRYHFVAIGGIGMSALARILLARGVRVSGSDKNDSPMLATLRDLGAEVQVGHAAAHVRTGDLVVLSDAIKPDNPEWQQALALGLPIIRRADLLGYLTNSGRGVAVAGTHGKTTTSGMLACIFLAAELDPTCVLGGVLAPMGGNARTGSDLILVEACEAYNSFLELRPEAAIIMNLEVDHLDFHGTPEHLFGSFRQFLGQVRGYAVLNGDDVRLREMATIAPRTVTYGADADNAYRYTDVRQGVETTFTLWHGAERVGEIALRVPGLHNVSNATGAAALALEWGVPFAAIARGLAEFPGMGRRFDVIGFCGPATVVDDYAHHPTEIRATLAAARGRFPGRVIAIFQPHLFSRTRDLLDDFADALGAADVAFVAPIYPAREAPIPGVTHEGLVARIPGDRGVALPSLEDAVARIAVLTPPLAPGDVILTIGAGDVDRVARALTAR
jgi:UDP-N-acetylmuramate--alanine ligase